MKTILIENELYLTILQKKQELESRDHKIWSIGKVVKHLLKEMQK